MSDPLHNELAAALVLLRDQQEDLAAATKALAETETTTRSRDRLVEATVDNRGRLTGLKLTGRRFRDLSAAELCAKIAETVRAAQQEQEARTVSSLARFAPPGVDVAAMFDGTFDPEEMIASAGVSIAESIDAGLIGMNRGGLS